MVLFCGIIPLKAGCFVGLRCEVTLFAFVLHVQHNDERDVFLLHSTSG